MSGFGSLGPSTVGLAHDNPLTDLLDLSPDVYFPDRSEPIKKLAFLKVTDPTKPKDPIVEKLTRWNLDITRISNKVLVMGRCWSYRTDREACRNNIEEMACFLNARFEKNYLIFNFGSPDIKYDTSMFRNQVVPFTVSKMLMLTIKQLFTACRAISAWLRLSKDHVVVIQCKNGKNRSGLVIGCLLRYCGLFDSTYDSFEYFLSKRSPNDSSWVSVTLRRYLRYFNDILILEGRIPSSFPLKLHQVILSTIPNFNGFGGCDPGIEIFQEGRLVYSSAVRLADKATGEPNAANDEEEEDYDEDLLREFKISMVLNPGKFDRTYNPLVMMDDYNIIFRLEDISLERDIQIRVYHYNSQAAQNVSIFNLAFNTGFMAPGLVRLRISDLEIPSEHVKSKFDPEFSVDLVVTQDEDSTSVVSYESSIQRSFMKDLMKLSQVHAVRADPLLQKPLELQGHRKFFVKLALQMGNNDIHAAHEFLSFLSKSPKYYELDKELNELTKEKYEKAELEKMKIIEPKVVVEVKDRKVSVNPILAAINKANADETIIYASGGLPFLASLKKATESRKDEGSLGDISEGPREEKLAKKMSQDELNGEKIPVSGPPSTASRKEQGDLKESKEVEERTPLSGPPFLAGLMKATASRRSHGEHQDGPVDKKEEVNIPTAGPPFLAGLMKATASRRGLGELKAIDEYKDESIPTEPPFFEDKEKISTGGLPFLAGLTKAASSRLDFGALKDESEKVEAPPKGPAFLSSLIKATSHRKNIGIIEGSEKEDRALDAKFELPPMAKSLPEAPPLPDYLRHGPNPASSNIPPAPPLPEHLRWLKSPSSLASSLGSSNINLSVADDLSRSSTPPPYKSFAQSIEVEEQKQKIKNKLHWGEIRGEERIRNTIWSELNDQPSNDDKVLDVHRFEELFCVDPNDENRGRRIVITEDNENIPKNSPRIIDSRRANNVGIGLSRFYKRMNNQEIINAIVNQQHLLDSNDLLCLKAILPAPEEVERLSLFKGDPKALVASEQFLLEMSKVPSLHWMVDALIYELQFSNEYDSLSKRLSAMTTVLIKVRESPGLKTLFKLVLELGNLANYDYGRVPAHMRIRGKALGFTMDSLLKLHEVKSVDRKSSLLNYLLMVVNEKNPDLLFLHSDFADMSTIKHWDSNGLYGEVDSLRSGLDRLCNIKSMDSDLVESFRETQSSFIALAKSKIEKLTRQVENLKSAWNDTAGYLGEDSDDKKPEELLMVFDQFFKQFKETHEQNTRSSSSSRQSKASKTASKDRIVGPPSVSGEIPSRLSSPVSSEIATESTVDTQLLNN